MQAKTKSGESFGEKISDILTPIPTFADPEDDINEETKARVVDNEYSEENYEENDKLIRNFRKQNIDLLEDLDKRYVGKRSSRKEVQDDELSDDDSSHLMTIPSGENKALGGFTTDQNSLEESGSYLENEMSDEEVETEEDDDEDESDGENFESDDEDQESRENDGQMFESEDESNFKHMNDVNITSQVSKGTCVRNQLNIWENLLEFRIQLQKCLLTANKMPQREHFLDIKQSNSEYINKVAESKEIVTKVLDKLLLLQSTLLKKYPETKNLDKKGIDTETVEDSDEEIPSDTEEEKSEKEEESEQEVDIPRKKMKLNNYEEEINRRHNLYRKYRNSVIQKWNEKTRVAVAKSNTSAYSVVNQIEHILADRDKLVRRTQLKRSHYEILGFKSDNKEEEQNESEEKEQLPTVEEYNKNIFDDDDFYHQLLRELIEFKSADISDPVQLGRQWIQLQNLRSKMKRKIDTRATKGRKVRYAVHTKLVNFMAPIDQELMTDEAKNELFSSLFGKSQPVVNVDK